MNEMPAESHNFDRLLKKYADLQKPGLERVDDSKQFIDSEVFSYLREQFQREFETADKMFHVFMSGGIFQSLVKDILHRTEEALHDAGTSKQMPEGLPGTVVRVFPRWLFTRTPCYARLVGGAFCPNGTRNEAGALRMDFLEEIALSDIEQSLLAGAPGERSIDAFWASSLAKAITVAIRKILESKKISAAPKPLNRRRSLFDLNQAQLDEGSTSEDD